MSELYVVATPIGNLGDMSARAVEVLNRVDLIAAEDTRHSGRLLQHFGISTALQAYHEHNEKSQLHWLLEQLKQGKKIALISDAGTPLISDPGYQLVKAAREQGVKVIPIPGPSALIVALCASGLPSDRFVFEGFLPAKSKARQDRLFQLKSESRTVILYESPHRILASIADMITQLGGERSVVLARELTKTYETIHEDSLENLLAWLKADINQQRGEMVILIKAVEDQLANQDEVEDRRILTLLLNEVPLKQAATLAAKITGRHKNEMYSWALELKKE
ncbi:MAG: 16S rRNA (cytidine(1402)-2'-O)-methyltransferase [Pseudomonadales bacterium]|nr:16S rRNA (cytidine(1402)-2'-O)-methyltransferase [Pseudomonadales bacterium]